MKRSNKRRKYQSSKFGFALLLSTWGSFAGCADNKAIRSTAFVSTCGSRCMSSKLRHPLSSPVNSRPGRECSSLRMHPTGITIDVGALGVTPRKRMEAIAQGPSPRPRSTIRIARRVMEPMGLTTPLVTDVMAAVLAGITAAPLVAVLDEAVTLSASGKKNLWTAVGDKFREIAKAPLAFFMSAPFMWLWAVYAATYISANAAETIANGFGTNPATPVLVISTAVNMGMCLLKDAAFARMYGGSGKKEDDEQDKAKLSRTVLSVWFVRDIVTQFFVFTTPLLLQGQVPDMVVRLSAPVLAQYFTTPFHLLGMRLYSLPKGTSIASQWPIVRAMLFSTTFARQMRIFPAFSVSGVVNKQLRVSFLHLALGAK